MLRRDAILDALTTALNAAGKPTGTEVERYRTVQQPADQHISVYHIGTAIERSHGSQFGALAVHKMRVRLDLTVKRVADTEPADGATSDLLQWAWRQAVTDATLRALVLDIEPIISAPDVETFDKTYTREAFELLVTFDSDLTDPAAMPGEASS